MITSICTIGTSHSVRDVGPVQSEATQKKMLLKNGTGGLTMAEYIKRETLLERAEYDNNYRLIIPAEVIKAAPAADVAPVVHGRWISFLDGDHIMPERYYRCSRCGRVESRLQPYCHCGAKMDGGEE